MADIWSSRGSLSSSFSQEKIRTHILQRADAARDVAGGYPANTF